MVLVARGLCRSNPHFSYRNRQGLTYADGTLWESNGLYGRSTVRILDPDSADVIKSVDMPHELFGEGMAYWQDKLYQITWKSGKGFIYNATTLETIDQFKFHTTTSEGWGITWSPCENEFVVTDGSPNLHFWDKDTLAEKRKIPVTRMDGSPATELNEIEWFRGKILANVWFKDVLLVIDPVTGTVEKEYGKWGSFIHLSPRKDPSRSAGLSHKMSFLGYRYRFQSSFPQEGT
jgi:glutamine cyclotransferase